ncbi:MAG: hypothetical protein WCJ25_01250 [Candidatus Moraniibacteriota bacterium]
MNGITRYPFVVFWKICYRGDMDGGVVTFFRTEMNRESSFFPGMREGLPEKHETEKLGIRMTRGFGRKSPGDVLFSETRSFLGRIRSESRRVSDILALDASESVDISPLEGENMTDYDFAIPKGMVFL